MSVCPPDRVGHDTRAVYGQRHGPSFGILPFELLIHVCPTQRLEQPAYRLAVTVCNGVADKLQRPVCQYFTDIIVESAHDTSSDDEDDDKFEQLQNAHELIKRLHQTCPAILHGVIPQLAEELRVDHVDIRQLATQALGEMYADKNGAELATKYPATWDVWISRKNDKVVAIRLKFVESLRLLLANLPIKCEALAGEWSYSAG